MSSEFVGADDFGVELGTGLYGGPPTPFAGDFYCEPDDVTRGLTLSFREFAGTQLSEKAIVSIQRFQSTDLPPELSSEVAAYLSPTMLCINRSSPINVGNGLIELLEATTGTRVCKVNRKKFTVKASIFWDNLECEIKMRIYHREEACTVEFQRYSGDSLTFCRFYRRAAAYLKSEADC